MTSSGTGGSVWRLGSTVFSRRHGVGKVRHLDYVANAKGEPILAYGVRFAGARHVLEVPSSLLHLVAEPTWSGGLVPVVAKAVSRAPALANSLFEAVREGSQVQPGSKWWQLAVIEPARAVGPSVRCHARFLQRGRTLHLYDVRLHQPLTLAEEAEVRLHGELASANAKALSSNGRQVVLGLPQRIEEPTTEAFR